MFVRLLCIYCVLFVSCFETSYAANSNATLEASSFSFQVKANEISNLAFQLDCLAGGFGLPCSVEAYRELWQTQLNWSNEDEAQLARWRQLRQKYQKTIDFNDAKTAASRYPDDLAFSANKIFLNRKQVIAGLQSRTLEEYQSNAGLLVMPSDLSGFTEVILHFQPRFRSWWNGGAKKHLDSFAARLSEIIKQKSLVEFSARVAKFYGAQLPANHVIYFNLMARPVSKARGTFGTQIENHAIAEILEGEDPKNRVDVLLHELYHYFYSLMPTAEKAELTKVFVSSPDPDSLAAYNLFDEALATAIGNGLVARLVKSESDFQRDFNKEGGFYNDYFIDRAGKKLLPLVERRINEGQAIDAGFVAEYLRITKQTLGDTASSPLLALRFMPLVFEDLSQRPAVENLVKAVKPRQTFATVGFDAASREYFQRYSEISGVIILRADKLPQLAGWEGIIGKETLPRLQELAAKHQDFVYAARRSPKSKVYIFVGRDNAALEKIITSFTTSNTAFDGVRYGL